MAFKAELTFDTLDDVYQLIQTLTKPDPRLGTVINSLNLVSERIQIMNAALQARLDTLTQRVAAVDGAEQSVLALVTEMRAQLSGLRDELAASGVDEAQLASLDALNDRLASETQQIAEAVTGPTQPAPAEPAPVDPTPAPPVDVPAEPVVTDPLAEPPPPGVDPAAPGEGVPPVVPQPDDTVTIPPAPDPNAPTI